MSDDDKATLIERWHQRGVDDCAEATHGRMLHAAYTDGYRTAVQVERIGYEKGYRNGVLVMGAAVLCLGAVAWCWRAK